MTTAKVGTEASCRYCGIDILYTGIVRRRRLVEL